MIFYAYIAKFMHKEVEYENNVRFTGEFVTRSHASDACQNKNKLVLIIYLGLIALSAYIYPPKVEAGPFVFLVIVFSVGFFGSLLDQRRTTALALGETIRSLSYH